MYVAPLVGDLRLKAGGDLSALLGKSAATGANEDYCARPRGAAPFDLGALESSLGDCATNPPPKSSTGSTDAGADGSVPGGDAGSASSSGGATGTSSSGSAAVPSGDDSSGADDGCGCRTTRARGAGLAAWIATCVLAFSLWRRRR
jgi:hypothetical protein